ncbi:uroporphyrinogen-III C-methyltransferase [Marinobacter sp. M216]|uniref:Uroporphyrinogen-III C-methyltransferase n=1 Tax=Marinobacter albus TaxID=3030833 RepID=A0ABT7HH36_9GAMM|nr:MULTISPECIES: uroporphyrinogen-III C-methyltransferase [unclassified Marinobacter]MBW7472235.1 uroporphyrinogen-III C-methyltransferase [Marinobacter sp. F4218]MDK9558805.1 uroporphyrinogen-III C-methyltransferase [Marinobacter sp. M216]
MTETTDQLPATISKESPKRQRLWPVWLIALLALALAIALALWSWQQWNNHQAVQQSLTNLQQDTQQLEDLYGDRGSQQNQRIQALEQKLAAQRELIATQQRQIDHNARELLEAGNRTRTDWLLAEAEYLLRIANQRLMIEKDIRGALSALQAADEVLTESDDIGVYPVRQQLAREILALKGISGVDRTGLYLQLEAAIDSIHQLTDQALINSQAPGFIAEDGGDSSSENGSNANALAEGWDTFKTTLKQVVVVRRLDEPVKPLLSPDQSAYARLNLQLMLEEAEMAVLRGNQPLFERALAKARNTIDNWYDASNARVMALSNTLTELADRNVDPTLPDISKSLGLLKERLAGRLQANDEDDSNARSSGETEGNGGDDS